MSDYTPDPAALPGPPNLRQLPRPVAANSRPLIESSDIEVTTASVPALQFYAPTARRAFGKPGAQIRTLTSDAYATGKVLLCSSRPAPWPWPMRHTDADCNYR